jgi:hypothetical protein
MKVKDLIEELQKCDPDMSVCLYVEHNQCAEYAWSIDPYYVNDEGDIKTRKDLEDDAWSQEDIEECFKECIVIFS